METTTPSSKPTKTEKINGVDTNFGINRLNRLIKGFIVSKIVKTRKPHVCSYCLTLIQPGEQCYSLSLRDSGYRYRSIWYCLDTDACEFKVSVREGFW